MYQTQSFDITFYRDLPNSMQLRFHTQKSLIYNFIILVNHLLGYTLIMRKNFYKKIYRIYISIVLQYFLLNRKN